MQWFRMAIRVAAGIVVCLLLVAVAAVIWFVIVPIGLLALIYFFMKYKKPFANFLNNEVEVKDKSPR